MTDARADTTRILRDLGAFGSVLALKQYRVPGDLGLTVPTLPCLDHEAMLHGGIPAHVAVYLQEASHGDLHELVFYPAERVIEIDVVSTTGEHSAASKGRLEQFVRQRFSEYRVRVNRPSWWRGEQRVAEAVLAQVSLREVLLGHDFAAISARISRLQTISSLMEKESRVASWGVRTVTGPLLTAAGVVTVLSVGSLSEHVGEGTVAAIRYGIVGALGAVFLYYGLKAVQLTEMANRVWKRATEYALILAERQRIVREASRPPA